ncbi:hypothetical protein HCTV-16_gp35 [Haloarcula virus HCTV-16]|nr:hypothetical protein HCTV-16_gp35 [Haloarcula virus HCTV-16]
MSDLRHLTYAPASDGIHVWEVLRHTTEYLFCVDEVCDGENCVTADDFDEEREVSVEDTRVERKGVVTLYLEGVASELDDE